MNQEKINHIPWTEKLSVRVNMVVSYQNGYYRSLTGKNDGLPPEGNQNWTYLGEINRYETVAKRDASNITSEFAEAWQVALGIDTEFFMILQDWTANGKIRTDKLESIALSRAIPVAETSIDDFLPNAGNYDFQEGDFIAIAADANPNPNYTLYYYNGGDINVRSSYLKTGLSNITMSMVDGLIDALNGKLEAPNSTGFYFLSSNGTNHTWQIINPSSYYLSYWNGSGFVGSSLYQNNVSQNIGFNTQSPTEALHINGGKIRMNALVFDSNDEEVQHQITYSGRRFWGTDLTNTRRLFMYKDFTDYISMWEMFDANQMNEIRTLINLSDGYKGYLKKTTTAPTVSGLYKLIELGTYPNLTPGIDESGASITVTAVDGKTNEVYFDGTDWMYLSRTLPQATQKIVKFSDLVFPVSNETQAIYQNLYWKLKAGQTATSSDVPGFESTNKWELIGSKPNESEKITFTEIIKFDKKRKHSVVNQIGDINFIFDSSGIEKDAMIKVDIISDGSSDINFSSDFDVYGDIDKTKNQMILFNRETVIEFKPMAVVTNVSKSGQITPVDLDPDAQLFYDNLMAAGATNITIGLTEYINNLFLTMKSNGYFSKLKGLYLVLGNTTNSRLVNAISSRPNALLVSGTVTNNGIEGVLDSQMKPADIFSLSSFSYGINNTTAIYSNAGSMGCNTSATSGIVLICVASSPSGQFLFSGPNRDIYANAAMADSLGTYVVSRTGAALAKLFKNGSLYFTHTASQGSATLPDINFAIGGYNTNGTFADDGRITKWAFLGDGLSDSEAVAITNDLNNFMTSIGR